LQYDFGAHTKKDIFLAQRSDWGARYALFSLLLRTSKEPYEGSIYLATTHCEGTGFSKQHTDLMASYLSFFEVGKMQTTHCT
jgi:hypothetical protein